MLLVADNDDGDDNVVDDVEANNADDNGKEAENVEVV